MRFPVALSVLVVATALAGCAQDAPAAGRDGSYAVTSLSDVHGIAVHPDDARILYVATHTGLVRGVDGTGWARVGDSTDDLMGFTAHPTNASIVWSSGHPSSQSATERNLGFRVSRDSGATWVRLGLAGVDLHAIAASTANPDHLWGWSAGKIHRTLDGGRVWQVVATASQLSGLSGHPTEADTVLSATPNGLLRSRDGGVAWDPAPLASFPVRAVVLDPKAPTTMYAAAPEGVRKSTDGGSSWTPLTGSPAGVVYLAISPQEPRVIWAATSALAIHRTLDGGGTWGLVRVG